MKNNKYITLMKNTLIFAAGTFGSKLIAVLLMPFYTRMLSTAQYGIVNNLVDAANLIMPIISLSISDAIIRFALDKSVNKKDVFSSGLLTVVFGFLGFLFFIPLMSGVRNVSDYLFIVYFYVLASALNSICGQFVRASVSPKLFAWAGFQNTILVIVLNLIFLLGFKMGVTGYVLSIALADLISAIFLFFAGRLSRYVDLKHLKKSVWRGMILFAIPLIPNAVAWWITSVSNRFMITYMIGDAATGLYAAAYKIPTLVTLISTIFTQAWQLSAISEFDEEGQTVFYRRVFSMYETVVFLAAAFIVVLCRPINSILVAPEYNSCWIFIPFLILAFVFQCFSGFWATIYMAARQNISVMITTVLGAVLNVILNLILIPMYGPLGAAFATFMSYFAVFVCRMIDSRRFIRVKINLRKLFINFAIVLIMAVILVNQPAFYIVYEIVLLALIVSLNMIVIKNTVTRFIQNLKKNHIAAQ